MAVSTGAVGAGRTLEQDPFPYLDCGRPPGIAGNSAPPAMIELAVFLKQNGYRPDQVQDFIPAPLDVATCMYYTGMDPFTKKPVYIAKTLKDRKMQRALMQFFKPENYFEVRKALLEANRKDLIGEGCDCLIPDQPPKQALEKRREEAGRQFRGDYVHQMTKDAPGGKKKKKGPRKHSRFEPGTGYRPDRKSTRRRDP